MFTFNFAPSKNFRPKGAKFLRGAIINQAERQAPALCAQA